MEISKKSNKKTYIVFGIITMVVITSLLSLLISSTYASSEDSGFAGGIVFVILLSIIFLIGLAVFLWNVIKKVTSEN